MVGKGKKNKNQRSEREGLGREGRNFREHQSGKFIATEGKVILYLQVIGLAIPSSLSK